MRLLPYLHLLLLAACAAPGLGVMGGQSDTVEIGAFVFDVTHKGARAEAYRTNVVWSPKAHEVFAAGASAMEQVTGCHVVRSSVRGDVALIEADLLC